MMLNIFANHFRRHFVADRSGEIAVFPEFPAPQLPFDLRVLSEDRSRTQTLEPRHHLGNRIARRKRAEEMNVIRTHLHLFDGDVIVLSNLLKQFADTLGQFALQNLLTILRRPDQVISRIIGGVGSSSEYHARILSNPRHLGIGHRAPCQDASSIPAASSGALRSFFVKSREYG